MWLRDGVLAQNLTGRHLGIQLCCSFLANGKPWVPSPKGDGEEKSQKHTERQAPGGWAWWPVPILLTLEEHEERQFKARGQFGLHGEF